MPGLVVPSPVVEVPRSTSVEFPPVPGVQAASTSHNPSLRISRKLGAAREVCKCIHRTPQEARRAVEHHEASMGRILVLLERYVELRNVQSDGNAGTAKRPTDGRES